MSKTLAEQFDEARAAWTEVWRTIGEEIVRTRAFGLIVRFAEWADRRLPWLGWLDDRMPRWMRFGTREFFRAIGTLYLVVAGVVVVLALTQSHP